MKKEEIYQNISSRKMILFKPGFPKLLVHRYPLATLTGLHVPPKFCDVSLKKKIGLHLVSATNFPNFCLKSS